ncbi:hypothetical protein M2310_003817 [Rhizobium leguminosarum]|nr:hypothetical protein [Rhizobium leguminosarum]
MAPRRIERDIAHGNRQIRPAHVLAAIAAWDGKCNKAVRNPCPEYHLARYRAILWKVALLRGACQFFGAQLGSRMAMRTGAKLIKPLLVIVCVALAVKLLADPTNPLRPWLGV